MLSLDHRTPRHLVVADQNVRCGYCQATKGGLARWPSWAHYEAEEAEFVVADVHSAMYWPRYGTN